MSRLLKSTQKAFLETFKISKCTKKKCDKKKCDCYHDNSDKRRNPFFSDSTNTNRFNTDTYKYNEYKCRDGENCSDSQCGWAHSSYEIKYHPNVTLIFNLTYKLHLKIN
jgi:hypothetical protein